nr:hypothetical protein [Tanacetum cinerariifolium]
MIVEQQVAEGDADEVHGEDVNVVGVATEGVVSAVDDVVPTANEKPYITSPTPPTPPPQPSYDILSISQVQPTPPQSPQVQPQSPQPQPQQDAGISMNFLQELMDTCTTLTRRVEHLELDKIAQALEITKLKQRVKKLERRNKLKVLKLRRLKRVGSAQRIDTSDDTVMDDVSKQGGIIENINADEDVVLEDATDVAVDAKDGQVADAEDNADIQGRTAESQAQIYKIDPEHANKVLSMQEEEKSKPAELQEVLDVVTTAKIITKVVTAASTTITAADVLIRAATTATAPSRRRKGVVIRDLEETTTTSIIIHSEAKSKDKGKGILVVDVITTAKIITEVVTAVSTTITVADVLIPAATTAAAPTLTVAPSRRRKGVVIKDPEETTTTSTIIHSEAKSKDKGKRILVEEPKLLKKQAQIEQDKKYARELEAELNKNIDWNEVIDHVQRKQKDDKAIKRYQALKRKPQTEAQARKNMMLYLKNVAGFKLDYFKGMTYDDISPIFEKHFNFNVDFLLKTKEQIDEDESRALKMINESRKDKAAKNQKLDEEVKELKRHLQIVPNKDDDIYTEATPRARKVSVVDYEIYNQNNKPYYKIKRADGSH